MALVAAYMMPHPPIAVHEIGRGDEAMIQDTLDAFHTAAEDIAALAPETIIITSPHAVMYRDYFHISPGPGAEGDFRRFRAGEVRISVRYDEELVSALCGEAKKKRFPAGCLGESDSKLDHGTMVPLYFINKCFRKYKIIRIGLSGLSLEKHWELGRLIRRAVDKTGRRCVFLASGDLAHCQKEDGPYGYRAAGPAYDKRLMEVMEKGDFEALKGFDERLLEDCMECGHRSFTIMGGAFEGVKMESRMLSHEATFGVGYGICMYHPLTEEESADK